jgi:hypothetical protein
MKNLLTKTRQGQHTKKINDSIGCNFQKEIQYDVYTELWEYDTENDYIDILGMTCNDGEDIYFIDNEYVILKDFERLNLKKIIEVKSFPSNLQIKIHDSAEDETYTLNYSLTDSKDYTLDEHIESIAELYLLSKTEVENNIYGYHVNI